MSDNTPRIEAYGSASISPRGPHDISQFLKQVVSPSGCPGMLLGRNADIPTHGALFALEAEHKGHALTFGRTRGGKGVSAIIPALLSYSGSMVVIDPKGENAWITAERRRQMGQRVVILDPWDEVNKRYGSKAGVTEKITKFNPLSALDPKSPDFADDVSAIADAFILKEGSADPHWPDSARELVGGLIAAEVQENPGKAAMRGVRKSLVAPIDLLKAIVQHIIEKHPGSVAASKLAAIVEKGGDGKTVSTNEISSIRSTARTQTSFLDSARLIDSMLTDEQPFDLADLAKEKVTLYLVLPVDRLKTHGRWLRMILTLAIRAISRADKLPPLPVTFILDEMGTISPGSGLSMIEQSFGLMAGLGIRIWAFLQDLPQLQRDYPDSWETFISNSSVIQLLNVADNTTAKYFSEYLGNYTADSQTGDWTYKMTQYGPNDVSYTDMLVATMTDRLLAQGPHGYHTTPDQARQAAYYHFHRQPNQKASHHEVQNLNNIVFQHLKDHGYTQEGVMKWTQEKKPVSRPVMFPWELVGVSQSKCILIMPGLMNFKLDRIVYYNDPHFSKLARPDPNRTTS